MILSQNDLDKIEIQVKESELRILKELIATSDDENITTLLEELYAVAKIIYASELVKMLAENRKRLIKEAERKKIQDAVIQNQKNKDINLWDKNFNKNDDKWNTDIPIRKNNKWTFTNITTKVR